MLTLPSSSTSTERKKNYIKSSDKRHLLRLDGLDVLLDLLLEVLDVLLDVLLGLYEDSLGILLGGLVEGDTADLDDTDDGEEEVNGGEAIRRQQLVTKSLARL